jgi:hypothetical protein
LEQLIDLAIPLCKEAQRQCPRTGPGRKPNYDDWQIAIMILCGVLKKKKTIAAQFRFISQNREMLLGRLKLDRLPAHGTFYERYKRVWRLVQMAIELQGRAAISHGVADARDVAVDKSLMRARGPQWHQKYRKRGVVPKRMRGVDRQAGWGYSEYHGWCYGYSYEAVVTATKGSVVFPLLASFDVASASEHKTFAAKIAHLPPQTRNVLADSGYDGNANADAVELDACDERPVGRRMLCPPQRGRVGDWRGKGKRERRRQRRLARHRFIRSRAGKALYRRRGQTIEPFNGTFKDTFELSEHVWHRGLDNNRTQALCAIFAYQLLIRWHWTRARRNAQIRYLLDGL